jgi:kumamolisin
VYAPGDVGSEQAWVDLMNRAIHPGAGDPVPSVITSSWYINDRDDAATLSAMLLDTISAEFQDAAALGVTVFVAAGDSGSASRVLDGNAHVQYPGSDPWVTSVGGTTIGNVSGSSFTEIVWNDEYPPGSFQYGATGGGVSDYFPVPAWQTNAGVSPTSVNDHLVRRGVPDIAGNASLNSGFPTDVNGGPRTFGGTSQTAPFYAGLAATINAAIHTRIGFLNPTLYAQSSKIFRDITSGDNLWQYVQSTPHYTAGPGWDACSGLGVVDGKQLLGVLQGVWSAEIMASLPMW